MSLFTKARCIVVAAMLAVSVFAQPATAASSITASIAHTSWHQKNTQTFGPSINGTGGNWIGIWVVATADVYLTTHVSDTIGGVASGNVYTLAFKTTSTSTIVYYYFICENAVVGASQVFSVDNPLNRSAGTAVGVDIRGGVATSSSYDSSSYVQAFGNPVTTKAVGPTTPTNDGSLLILFESQGVGVTTTVSGGGFSAMQDDEAGVGGTSYQGGVATQIQGAKTASTPTVSASSPSSNYIDAFMFAIKPASYSGGGGAATGNFRGLLGVGR